MACKKPDLSKLTSEDYYMENDRVVFTAVHLAKRKDGCCGKSCRHCPFTDPTLKGCRDLKPEFAHLASPSLLDEFPVG